MGISLFTRPSSLLSYSQIVAASHSRQRMPGELLPIMAAPSISKSKLSRAKADLYLIVSKTNSCGANGIADSLVVRRRYDLRARHPPRPWKHQTVAGIHRIQVSTWHPSRQW